MSVPPFAPLPPTNIRLSLGPEEWEACLDAWLTLCTLALRLPTDDFVDAINDDDSLPAFLVSFYQELGTLSPQDTTLNSPNALLLRKSCFKLVNKAYTEWSPISKSLLNWDFLSHFCRAHVKNPALPQVMADFWQTKSALLTMRLKKQKELVTKALEVNNDENLIGLLTQLAPILHASADIGAFFMTGTDFLDSLVSSYSRMVLDEHKKAISTVLYLGLFSLVKTETPNVSLLSDHLYSLKSQADKTEPSQLALVDVVTNTSFVARIRQVTTESAPDRLSKLLDSLETYRTPSIARPKKRVKRSHSKGKGKWKQGDGTLNVHRMSLVTQVQDLFPDLGSAFVVKLLDEYDDDVEQVTAHLLDDSLPSHLATSDRTEQVPDAGAQDHVDHLAPRSLQPLAEPFIPERRNVFDNDEFDQLEFDTSRLHIGKQNRTESTGDQPNKSAILSALAAFDSDDDERDDTYDQDDVGGTIDTPHPDGEPGPAAKIINQENDTALFNAYKSSPELFGRTFDVRKGQARQALKTETGMTDEAIEGWAIMLQRDPRRLRRLEMQSGAFDGRQSELASTAYRESPGNTETEDSDAPQGVGRGGFRGRGRGFGRGRGGNVSGPSSDPNTAQAQRRKEASKGSRANHNRRDQRARKMGRGGFPG